jgi:uncharacterized membrane protein
MDEHYGWIPSIKRWCLMFTFVTMGVMVPIMVPQLWMHPMVIILVAQLSVYYQKYCGPNINFDLRCTYNNF